ncbi:MAG TPA: hypothetical protein DEB06_02790 [Phycisphaerales bacterium]|nr:hypothetical protein [Phycisphaerales bacterium]
MSDAQLARVDPLIVNLTIAKGLVGLESLDVDRYRRFVDDLANRIRAGLSASEPSEMTSELYLKDPDLWRVGSMAVALAGPSIGIDYSDAPLTTPDPKLLFVHGVIDTRRGTCSSMPVLYLAIAHRLGWPLKAVVAGDHFWCRWDDGVPGGKRFNIEATSAASDGTTGSFSSAPDAEYRERLGVQPVAKRVGSDLASLTPRQTLGVYLQTRAACWSSRGDWERAEHDLLLARVCFPENRDIFAFLVQVMHERAGLIFTESERWNLAPRLPLGQPRAPATRKSPGDPLEHLRRVQEFNESTRRRQFGGP